MLRYYGIFGENVSTHNLFGFAGYHSNTNRTNGVTKTRDRVKIGVSRVS